VAAIYILLPKLFDTQNVFDQLGDANAIWIAVACLQRPRLLLLRGAVPGRCRRAVSTEWRESYQITMAGLAATRFSAGGARGIVLTYRALRKAGCGDRRRAGLWPSWCCSTPSTCWR
jgi:hypothetical protein